MRRLIYDWIMVVVWIALTIPLAAIAADFDIQLDIEEFTLENGMQFLLVERHTTPQVACHKVGSRRKNSVAAGGEQRHQRLGAAHRGPARAGGERIVERMLGAATPPLRRREGGPGPVVGLLRGQAQPAGRIGTRTADDPAQRHDLVVVQRRCART